MSGARIAREKLLGHGEDGDHRKQRDPELHRHDQGPARRRIEIHLSGAAGERALGQGLPEAARKPAETEEERQRHGDRGSDHDDPRRRRANPDHAHDGADHRVEIEPDADDEAGEERHVEDEEAQPVSEAGRTPGTRARMHRFRTRSRRARRRSAAGAGACGR